MIREADSTIFYEGCKRDKSMRNYAKIKPSEGNGSALQFLRQKNLKHSSGLLFNASHLAHLILALFVQLRTTIWAFLRKPLARILG